MLTALTALALAGPSELVFYDDLPTTLHPAFPATEADVRAQRLVSETLWWRDPVG